MAIIVSASDPSGLLQKIRVGIAENSIETWKVDVDGDFSHSPPQWINKAWFKPIVGTDTLMFGLLGVKNTSMTKGVYGVYHGRFIEMLLSHFDKEFTGVSATAKKDARADNFS